MGYRSNSCKSFISFLDLHFATRILHSGTPLGPSYSYAPSNRKVETIRREISTVIKKTAFLRFYRLKNRCNFKIAIKSLILKARSFLKHNILRIWFQTFGRHFDNLSEATCHLIHEFPRKMHLPKQVVNIEK